MYFLIYLTERCNLRCAYCDAIDAQAEHAGDLQYPLDDLIAFLNDDDNLGLQFYGGEPLLRPELMVEILERTQPQHVTVQTNGYFLDRIPEHLFDRIDIICLSVDGDRKTTDRVRGEGVYDTAIAGAQQLRARGFTGRIDARMTTSPGVHIYDAVTHLLEDCAFRFDAIYWQLNVLFHNEDWHRDQRFIRRWFERYYNPQITKLVDAWTTELTDHGRLWNIVPFAGLMHDLISGQPAQHVRCGAGHSMWAVTTEGAIYPCPVMRRAEAYAVGTINDTQPSAMTARYHLLAPCDTCDVLAVCGGRCLSANAYKRWGEDGFALVCNSVRHLIAELERVKPVFVRELQRGMLRLSALDVKMGYEVIP